MEIERALETQRLRLLRHVARLGALVAFMSFGPLSNRLPRWVRSLVIYLLRPAEDAANCMVQVMICLIANGRCPSRPRAKMSYVSNTHDLQFHDAPSTPTAHKVDTPLDESVSSDTLRRRLAALIDKLEDLHGHALRVMQKQAKQPPRRVTSAPQDWAETPLYQIDIKRSFVRVLQRIDLALGPP